MHQGNSQTGHLKHGIGVAALVVLSNPGTLTALSPIVMPWASTGVRISAPSHATASANPLRSRHTV